MSSTQLRPEDKIAAECLCMPLRLVHRVVTGIYDEALRPLGVRIAQLNLLVGIARMSDRATHCWTMGAELGRCAQWPR